MQENPKAKYVLSDISVIRFIKDYWVLLVLITSFVATWTENRIKFQDLENRTTKVEDTENDNSVVFLQLQKDIVEIKTSILYIQKSVDNK